MPQFYYILLYLFFKLLFILQDSSFHLVVDFTDLVAINRCIFFLRTTHITQKVALGQITVFHSLHPHYLRADSVSGVVYALSQLIETDLSHGYVYQLSQPMSGLVDRLMLALEGGVSRMHGSFEESIPQ